MSPNCLPFDVTLSEFVAEDPVIGIDIRYCCLDGHDFDLRHPSR